MDGGGEGRTNPGHIRDTIPGEHAETHTERYGEEEEKLRQREENLAKMQQTSKRWRRRQTLVRGRVENAANGAGKTEQIPSYLHHNFDSLSPFTLNCETPSMNSETRNWHTRKRVASGLLTAHLGFLRTFNTKQGNALDKLWNRRTEH